MAAPEFYRTAADVPPGPPGSIARVEPAGVGRRGTRLTTRPRTARPGPAACQTPAVSAPRSELKGIGYEIFIGALSLLSIVNLFLVVAHPAGRGPAERPADHERDLQRRLPARLQLPAGDGPVAQGLLLPALRLGRPARQPAVRRAQVPAHLPPGPRRPAPARGRWPQGAADADPRPGRQRAATPCCSRASSCCSSAASRSCASRTTPRAPTSRTRRTRSGTRSPPSRPSATATSTRSPTRGASSAR